MSKEDNGGPAFPQTQTLDVGNPNGFVSGSDVGEGGMTLRDYFAAKADLGNVDELSLTSGVRLLGMPCPEYKDDTAGCFAWWAAYRSKLRYIEADAMLKARQS